MASLEAGTVARSLKGWVPLRKRKITAVMIAVFLGLYTAFDENGGPGLWLVGLTVSVGALTHILGDRLTRSGVPLS
ncbi:hypothetical protein BQ8420_23780 [Nocardiopsis sp. JB363]|nr:hypothetical protein BQ8420_23780 [Nocardiopsis sp. JB363]